MKITIKLLKPLLNYLPGYYTLDESFRLYVNDFEAYPKWFKINRRKDEFKFRKDIPGHKKGEIFPLDGFFTLELEKIAANEYPAWFKILNIEE